MRVLCQAGSTWGGLPAQRFASQLWDQVLAPQDADTLLQSHCGKVRPAFVLCIAVCIVTQSWGSRCTAAVAESRGVGGGVGEGGIPPACRVTQMQAASCIASVARSEQG